MRLGLKSRRIVAQDAETVTVEETWGPDPDGVIEAIPPILRCVDCRRFTTEIEASERRFHANRCSCGGALERLPRMIVCPHEYISPVDRSCLSCGEPQDREPDFADRAVAAGFDPSE